MREQSIIDLTEIVSVKPRQSKRPRVSATKTEAGPTAHDRINLTADDHSASATTGQADPAAEGWTSSTTGGSAASTAYGHADLTAQGCHNPATDDHAALERLILETQCRLWLSHALLNAGDASITDLPDHTGPTFACNAHLRLFEQPKRDGPSKPAIAPSRSPPLHQDAPDGPCSPTAHAAHCARGGSAWHGRAPATPPAATMNMLHTSSAPPHPSRRHHRRRRRRPRPQRIRNHNRHHRRSLPDRQ